MIQTRPELAGTFGMAASTHWLASSAAMSVLEQGGNAFDAVVAAGFVLQVVEPHLNGPAGEVPILLWSERDQQTRVVCGQGVAPDAATPAAFSALGYELIPGTGLLPATVPGAFGGWTLLLERWGTWELRDVLSFALHYSRSGYPAITGICDTITAVSQLFQDHWPTSRDAWLFDGRAPRSGQRLTNPALGATYERILAESDSAPTREERIRAARDVWYRGFVAEALVRFSKNPQYDGVGQPAPGLLEEADFASWSPTEEEPATYDYGPYTVAKTRSWGQGPVFLQQLALLSGFDLSKLEYLGADWIHLIVESAKLAFADREAWYGDSPSVGDPLPVLLSEDYNADRRRLISDEASQTLSPGQIAGQSARLPQLAAGASSTVAAGTGEPTLGPRLDTRGDTCHVDVVDRWGNMVSATPSGGWLQSSPHIPTLGFCLGTRAQMFALDPETSNTLAPRRRPRTTLSPTIAFRDGQPWLAFGTPGGDQQDQWSLAFFLSVVHGKLNLQQAIDAPAFHSEHFPSSFYPRQAHPGRLVVETRLRPAVITELERRGHSIHPAGDWALGRLSAVSRGASFLHAAANARGAQGYAVGR